MRMLCDLQKYLGLLEQRPFPRVAKEVEHQSCTSRNHSAVVIEVLE